MGEFFNLDNKFFQGLGKVIDCVVLNVLWLVCCAPTAFLFYMAWESGVVLFWLLCWLTFSLAGTATTAFYYTINKVIRHGRGYVWKEYWHAFRSNFKQSAVAALIFAGLGLFMGLDSYIMYEFAEAGEVNGAFYLIFVIFIALILMWAMYAFAYMARFENTTKQVLKNAGLIALANLPWTLLLFVLLLVAVFLVWLIPFLLILVPAAYMLIANVILEKIFVKYMSEEDIAVEQERNQGFDD